MLISENITHYFVKKNFFKQLGFKKRKLDEISEQDDIIMDESNFQGMYKNKTKMTENILKFPLFYLVNM